MKQTNKPHFFEKEDGVFVLRWMRRVGQLETVGQMIGDIKSLAK
jgi:hypothetical protein